MFDYDEWGEGSVCVVREGPYAWPQSGLELIAKKHTDVTDFGKQFTKIEPTLQMIIVNYRNLLNYLFCSVGLFVRKCVVKSRHFS